MRDLFFWDKSCAVKNVTDFDKEKRMAAKIYYGEKKITVFLEGELDHHSAAIIRAGIDDALFINRPKELILDFGGITFMDSSGIGLVMGRYKIMKSIGGKVVLASLSGTNEKLMKLAGLERLDNIEFKETASL